MIINTKFNIGQKVWFRFDNSTIFESIIEAITTDTNKTGKTTIEYWPKHVDSVIPSIYDESDVFETINEAENTKTANEKNKSFDLFENLSSIISPYHNSL
jgi:hypothetical protein